MELWCVEVLGGGREKVGGWKYWDGVAIALVDGSIGGGWGKRGWMKVWGGVAITLVDGSIGPGSR